MTARAVYARGDALTPATALAVARLAKKRLIITCRVSDNVLYREAVFYFARENDINRVVSEIFAIFKSSVYGVIMIRYIIVLILLAALILLSVSAQAMTCSGDANNPQPLHINNTITVRQGESVVVDIRMIDNDGYPDSTVKRDINDLVAPGWVTWFGPAVQPDPNANYPANWTDCGGSSRDPNAAVSITRPLKIAPTNLVIGPYTVKMTSWDTIPGMKAYWYLTVVVLPANQPPCSAGFSLRPVL